MAQLIYRVPQTQSAAHDKGSKISRLDVAFSLPLMDVIKDVDGILVNAKGEKGLYKGKMVKIRFVHGASTLVYDEQVLHLGIPANASTTNPNGYKASPLDKIIFSKGFYLIDDEEDPMRALFLKICNANGSNEHRVSKYAPMFIFVDRKKNAEKELLDEDIVYQAKTLIHKDLKKDSQKLRRLYRVMFGSDDALEDEEIRVQLLRVANKEPDSNNVSGAERILTAFRTLSNDVDDLIADAERLAVINISPTKITWNGDGNTIISYKAMSKAGSGAKVKLIEFLSLPENSETLDLLKNVVKEKRMEESGKLVVSS